MSERAKNENALRKGREAWRAGTPLEDNPMTARDSQLMWERGWKEEQEWSKTRAETLNRRLTDGSLDPHRHNGTYFTHVTMDEG